MTTRTKSIVGTFAANIVALSVVGALFAVVADLLIR
jgi:hypothetical protein